MRVRSSEVERSYLYKGTGALLLASVLWSCAQVRRGLARLAPSDTTTPASAHHVLVFSEAMSANSGGPTFVTLDSGVVYRLYLRGDGEVSLSARDSWRPPPRFAPIVFGEQSAPPSTAGTSTILDERVVLRFSQVGLAHAAGIPFEAPTSGEYRVEASRGPATGDYRILTPLGTDATVLVRIYREGADSLSAQCVADPHGRGCRNADDVSSRPRDAGGRWTGLLLLLPLVAWGLGH
jgi:hypothetical protein